MPDISQKELDHINAMVEQNLAGFDLDGMIDDMIPVYQRHLTKTDIAAMNQFYRTPTGQKMLREQPQMTAEAMKAAQPRIQNNDEPHDGAGRNDDAAGSCRVQAY